jgi:hypothetical protein
MRRMCRIDTPVSLDTLNVRLQCLCCGQRIAFGDVAISSYSPIVRPNGEGAPR